MRGQLSRLCAPLALPSARVPLLSSLLCELRVAKLMLFDFEITWSSSLKFIVGASAPNFGAYYTCISKRRLLFDEMSDELLALCRLHAPFKIHPTVEFLCQDGIEVAPFLRTA